MTKGISVLKSWIQDSHKIILLEEKDYYKISNLSISKTYKMKKDNIHKFNKLMTEDEKIYINDCIAKNKYFKEELLDVFENYIEENLNEELVMYWNIVDGAKKDRSMSITKTRFRKLDKLKEYEIFASLKTAAEQSYNEWLGSKYERTIIIYKDIEEEK